MLAYRAEIDGLRALAVLPVVLFHANIAPFTGGYIGVDVFFVISGYLITTILLKNLDGGSLSLGRFYERRARRILPALFVMVLVTIPFAWKWLLPWYLNKYSIDLLGVSFFISNILFWQRTSYFEPLAEENPLLHTWSLAVEEQFYLIFPVLLLLVWRYRKEWLFWLVLIACAASMGLSEWAWREAEVANFYLIPTRAWELGAGVLCALLLREGKVAPNRWLGLIGIVAILVSTVVFDKETPWPSLYALLPVVGTMLVILYARGNSAAHLLSWRGFVGIGLISYSVYLWHLPLIAFSYAQSETKPTPELLAFLAFASLPLGYLSWRIIERPFRVPAGERGHISRKMLIAIMSGAVFILVAAGIYGKATDGGLVRFEAEDHKLIHLLETRKIFGYLKFGFFKKRLAEFEDGKPKVLFVGDSFSMDVFNTLRENRYLDQLSVSTFIIGRRCGNLYVNHDLAPYIGKKYLSECQRNLRYHHPVLQERMREADYIVVASRWENWQIDMLPVSIANIRAVTDAKILLFSSKRFQRLRAYQLAAYKRAARGNLRFMMSEDFSSQLAKFRALDLPVIDIPFLVCGNRSDCPLFTEDGDAITYDNRHLTPAGAGWMGRLFYREVPLYRQMVNAGVAATGARIDPATGIIQR